MRIHPGAEPVVAGFVGVVAGLAAPLLDMPALGLVAGAAAAAAGVTGWRAAARTADAPPTAAPPHATELEQLEEELTVVRMRENALTERVAVLEEAARAAAAASLAGRPPVAPAAAAAPAGAPTLGAWADAAPSHFAPGAPPAHALAGVPAAVPSGRRGSETLLTDPETGLFSEAYFGVALEARIAAARRRLRPVALVLLEVIDGPVVGDLRGADPALVTVALRRTLREADTACRLDDGRFALVLEDTPENGAIWTVERIRTHLADGGASCTVWAGVACYPAHAFDKDEILGQATAALAAAREWRQDRIEVAQAE